MVDDLRLFCYRKTFVLNFADVGTVEQYWVHVLLHQIEQVIHSNVRNELITSVTISNHLFDRLGLMHGAMAIGGRSLSQQKIDRLTV